MGKKILLVWISLLVFIIINIYLINSQKEVTNNLHWIANIQATLSLIYDLQGNLSDAESAARGYVLNGGEGQLEVYYESIKEIDRLFGELGQITTNDLEQQRLLGLLKPLINQRQALLKKSIDLRRQRGFETPEHAAIARDGTTLQNQIRMILDKIENFEKRLLHPQWVKEQQKTYTWLLALTLGTSLSFIIILLSMYLLNREINKRQRTEEKLTIYYQRIQTLTSELTLVEERERHRLAIELHENIGQILAVARIKMGILSAKTEATDFSSNLSEIRKHIEKAIQYTRSLTLELSPPILYELGLEPAIEWLAHQIFDEIGIHVEVQGDAIPASLTDEARILLFLVVRELLNNVTKHAQAHYARINLEKKDDDLRILVEDDGIGFDVAKGMERSFGLFSISERLKRIGGRLEVTSQLGQGTQATVIVPLARVQQIHIDSRS